ncbi:MAG: hypothetical protein QOJ99_1184 [Bryobacterales bacterium]|nr:hypothetical protein [Bryobacterales bacterium]
MSRVRKLSPHLFKSPLVGFHTLDSFPRFPALESKPLDRTQALTGVGTDSSGNIYVVSTFAGTSIRKFSPSGSLLWHLKGLSFIDVAVADPSSDGLDLYTKHQHFTMDYNQQPGHEWSWAGMLKNKFKYPTDPYLTLLSGGNSPVALRNIKGRKYLFTTDMYSRSLSIYRIEGETAVPSGMIAPIQPADATAQLANFGVNSWLPGIAPQGSSFIWRDSNGNGNVDADEFSGVTGEETGIWGWDIDDQGNIWQTVEAYQGVREFAMQGVDSAGNLIYDRAHLAVYGVPSPFTQIERVHYDSGNDVMYLSGYTAAHPIAGGMWGQAGTEIARYDNWTKGNRNPRWRITLPYDVAANRTVKAISVAGGCVFASVWQSGLHENVYVYGSGTGAGVGLLTPGPQVGSNMGWVEGSYNLRAFQRANGEYLVFVTDEAWNKILMYRVSAPAAPLQAR